MSRRVFDSLLDKLRELLEKSVVMGERSGRSTILEDDWFTIALLMRFGGRTLTSAWDFILGEVQCIIYCMTQ